MVDALPPPPDVPCSGCSEPTPYEAGPADSDAPTYGETLRTPLGKVYARTHRRRECVIASRKRLDGKSFVWRTRNPATGALEP